MRSRYPTLVYCVGLTAVLCSFLAIFAPAYAMEASSEEATADRDPFELILAYTDVTVGPGQEFEMDAEVVNPRKQSVQVKLATEAVPEGWTAGFHSRYPSYPVGGVMVQGEKSNTLEFKANLPDKIEPGSYTVTVVASDSQGLKTVRETVTFKVSSEKVETGGLKMESQYPVLSGPTSQTFKFSIDLKNETDNPMTTSLAAQAPPGWVVRIKPQFEETQISSIALKKDSSETLSVEIQPPILAEPGEYPVTVRARSGSFAAQSDLKVTLTGTYDLKMGTVTGNLNASVTAGEKAPVEFLIANGGTAPLTNLSFISKKPGLGQSAEGVAQWEIEFNPDKIDSLNPGEVREVKMSVLAPQRTVAGDYIVGITANSPDTNESVDFRVTVATPTIWGWIGWLIVAGVVIGLATVFIRLGRR